MLVEIELFVKTAFGVIGGFMILSAIVGLFLISFHILSICAKKIPLPIVYFVKTGVLIFLVLFGFNSLITSERYSFLYDFFCGFFLLIVILGITFFGMYGLSYSEENHCQNSIPEVFIAGLILFVVLIIFDISMLLNHLGLNFLFDYPQTEAKYEAVALGSIISLISIIVIVCVFFWNDLVYEIENDKGSENQKQHDV